MNEIAARAQSALTSTGLVPADYTDEELAEIELVLGKLNKSLRLCRIDHATYLIDKIMSSEKETRDKWREARATYFRLAELYGISPATLRVEVSTMRRWPIERRVEGATVEQYGAVNRLPDNVAEEALADAVQQSLSIRDTYAMAKAISASEDDDIQVRDRPLSLSWFQENVVRDAWFEDGGLFLLGTEGTLRITGENLKIERS